MFRYYTSAVFRPLVKFRFMADTPWNRTQMYLVGLVL